MRESSYPLIPVTDAVQWVLTTVAPLEVISRHFDVVVGYVLAQDVMAVEPFPPFAASTVDGFAVRAAEGVGPLRLVGDQFAGYNAELTLQAGETVRITTGAPLPAGADAVVMVESADEGDANVRLRHPVNQNDNVRAVGSDYAAGQLLLPAGVRLGAAEVGLLASVGQTEVQVYRRPLVGVMSTGDELVSPEAEPRAGQIRDSNRFALLAALRENDVVALDLGIAPDDAEPLYEFMQTGLVQCDLLVTSGGVSMGERDLVKPLLEQYGTVHFGRVNLKPGKPTTFATLAGKPFMALPGNPVSSLVCLEVFLRPALRKMAGYREGQWLRPRITTHLSHPVRHDLGRVEFQRATVQWDNDHFSVATTGAQQSSRLLSYVGANALIVLPDGRGDFAEGEGVETWLISHAAG